MSTHSNVFGLRVSALLEIFFGALILLLVDQFLAGANGFWDIEPNPYWLVVILIAVQYGANEAVVAALFCSLLFLITADWTPPSEGQGMFTYYYDILFNPMSWFVVGLAAGALTERHLRKIVHQDSELDDAHQREETISESYNFVKERKEGLEVQLAGRLTSSVQAYKAAKAIETLNPKDVLRGVEELVSAILSPQKFSVFTLNDGELSANVLHGWTQDDEFKQAIDKNDSLYQSVIGKREFLSIVNQDHENALNHQGVLAGPVISPISGEVIGMLKIEQIPFANLGLHTVETFKALCEWIGSSLVNAESYQTVKEESVVNPEHNLMTSNYFKRQSDYLTSLAKRVNFDLSLIVVRMNDVDKLADADRMRVARELALAVKKALRSIDLAFEYQNAGEEYSLLLPATSQQGANVARDKIAKELEGTLRSLSDASVSYHIKALHEA